MWAWESQNCSMHGWDPAAFSCLTHPAFSIKLQCSKNGNYSKLWLFSWWWCMQMGFKGTIEFCWSLLGPHCHTRADVWHGFRVEPPQLLFCCTTGSGGLPFFQPSWQYLRAQKGHKIRINAFWTWHNPLLVQSYLQLVQEKCGISFLKTPELPTLSLPGEDQNCRSHS